MPPNHTAVTLRTRPPIPAVELEAVNASLESATPEQIVGWARDRFGQRMALTASFADTVLIDIAISVVPDIEVVFLDTGFHFAETLSTMREAMSRYAPNLTVLRPPADADDVWSHGSDACCEARKVRPLDQYLVGRVDAWLSGLRRADSADRAETPIVSIDRRGLVKVNPIATLSDADYEALRERRHPLVNPLADVGYASIGCWPCTDPSTNGRAGRWGGTRTECGLHR